MRNMASKSGFTLLEILVVVMIIGILAGIVGVSVLRRPGEARVSAARMQVKQLKHAVDLYRIDHGKPPTQQQGLQALVSKPTVECLIRSAVKKQGIKAITRGKFMLGKKYALYSETTT